MAKRADKKPDEKPRRNRGEAAKTKKVWRCDETPWREPEENSSPEPSVCLSAPSSPASSVRARQTGLPKSVLFFFPSSSLSPLLVFFFSGRSCDLSARVSVFFLGRKGEISRSKWNCDLRLRGGKHVGIRLDRNLSNTAENLSA